MAFKKKIAPARTLEDQLATANVSGAMYLAAFESAATGLEQTANDLDAVRDAAAEEVNRHLTVKLSANELAFKHRSQAQKIRELIG